MNKRTRRHMVLVDMSSSSGTGDVNACSMMLYACDSLQKLMEIDGSPLPASRLSHRRLDMMKPKWGKVKHLTSLQLNDQRLTRVIEIGNL
eukprot:m.275600 g.275600  ORF g.275600 m.275600 type:complete len:90 (+) comp19356_c1_seq5:3890-4159(+)